MNLSTVIVHYVSFFNLDSKLQELWRGLNHSQGIFYTRSTGATPSGPSRLLHSETRASVEMLNFHQRTWNVPNMSTFPEVPGGMLIHYSPLNELPRIHAHRTPTTGLVAARIQCFEVGDAQPLSPMPITTPTPPNNHMYTSGDTKQGIKVFLHYARLLSVSNQSSGEDCGLFSLKTSQVT